MDPKGKPKRDEGTIDQGFENDLQGARKRSMDVDTSLQRVERRDEEIARAKEKERKEERRGRAKGEGGVDSYICKNSYVRKYIYIHIYIYFIHIYIYTYVSCESRRE